MMNFSLSVPPLSMDHLSLAAQGGCSKTSKRHPFFVDGDSYLQIEPVNTGQIFFLLSHWSSGIGGEERLISDFGPHAGFFLQAFSACMVSTKVRTSCCKPSKLAVS